MGAHSEEWLRDYARLAFGVEHTMTGSTGGALLIYSGPDSWRPASGQLGRGPTELVDEGESLRGRMPFTGERANYLSAHLEAMIAAADHLADGRVPATDYASRCLGTTIDWWDEAAFEHAHDQLDHALPGTTGSIPDRLRAWQQAHTLPTTDTGKLPELVAAAVHESRRRTSEIVTLPDLEPTAVAMSAGPHRGHYDHGRSTIHISADAPFNLADLLYVVAHETFPGHIAESALKDQHLVRDRGQLEHTIRFLLSPSFLISEGIGLHAPALAFPDDQAQAWLTDTVLRPVGITADGGDFAAIHSARNQLWGAWGNAALLAADGRPHHEIADYLCRWALLSPDEAAWAQNFFATPGMDTYVLGYAHGWRLLDAWLDHSDRLDRARRLLVEPTLPAGIPPRT